MSNKTVRIAKLETQDDTWELFREPDDWIIVRCSSKDNDMVDQASFPPEIMTWIINCLNKKPR